MRVLFDAHQLGARQTGNETYVRGLLQPLSLQSSVDLTAAVVRDGPAADLRARGISVRRVPHNGLLRLAALSYLARSRKWDLIHSVYYLPPLAPVPSVVTIHDISFELYPEYFSGLDILRNRTLVRHAARHADAVVTVSETSRQEIVSRYDIDPERIIAIPNGVSPSFIPKTASPRQRTKGVRVLAVGTLQPRKNLLRLAAAVREVAQDMPVSLQVVGPDGFAARRIRETLGPLPDVQISGYLSEEALRSAYCDADVLVYPSLYEGFGLPVLEAMACGTPVITSNSSSMPEVAGDAALLVDPLDVEDIASAIRRVATDEVLAMSMAARGIVRAALFSWDSAARRLADVYATVLAARA